MLKEPSSLRPSTGSSACSQPPGPEWNDRERRCLTDLGLRACMTARSRHTKAAIAEFNDALRGVVEVMVDSKSGNAKDIVQGATELTDEFGERLWLSPALQDRPWLFEAAPVFSMNYERYGRLATVECYVIANVDQYQRAACQASPSNARCSPTPQCGCRRLWWSAFSRVHEFVTQCMLRCRRGRC